MKVDKRGHWFPHTMEGIPTGQPGLSAQLCPESCVAGCVALNSRMLPASARAARDPAGLLLLVGTVCWGHLLRSLGPHCMGPGWTTELEKANTVMSPHPKSLRAGSMPALSDTGLCSGQITLSYGWHELDNPGLWEPSDLPFQGYPLSSPW